MNDSPNHKSEKYDRQLRLWAKNGQTSIESCHICMIGITTANTELLKNLVLPGCGNFTIIENDHGKDFAHNFFWSESNSSILDNLKDLNPDVNGCLIDESVVEIIDKRSASFWHQFSLVILDDSIPTYEAEEQLLNILWDACIPVIKNVSYGFYGITRVIVREHCIIETHPESLVDLRIEDPWPELEEYADSVNIEELDNVDHAHVPYVIILIKLSKQWRLKHDNQAPSQRSRADFKKMIEEMMISPVEQNYQEALQFAHRATNPPVLTQSVADIISSSPEPNLSTPLFWIYTRALKNFMQKNNNHLPLSGVLPDMTADTLNYVKLQKIYKEKFLKDRDSILDEVREIITNIGRSDDDISEEMAIIFCKNSRFLTVQKGHKEPFNNSKFSSSDYQLNYLQIYFAFLAVEDLKKSGRQLKSLSKDKNFADLEESLHTVFEKYNISKEYYDDKFLAILKEIARSGGTELHNIASLMGGIGSQEALKFITGQYVPADNLVVLDGIVSHTECIKI